MYCFVWCEWYVLCSSKNTLSKFLSNEDVVVKDTFSCASQIFSFMVRRIKVFG